MPFKSKAQQRFMFAAEDRGEIPKGTAKEWADATKKKKGGIKALPEKVKKTAAEMAEELVKESAGCGAGTPHQTKMLKKKTVTKKSPVKMAEEILAKTAADTSPTAFFHGMRDPSFSQLSPMEQFVSDPDLLRDQTTYKIERKPPTRPGGISKVELRPPMKKIDPTILHFVQNLFK